jgi:hypothetical protein
VKQHDLKAQVKAFGIDSLLPPLKLTERQAFVLRAIHDHGPIGWLAGSLRAGGARGRMCNRLVEHGLLTGPPYVITQAGRDILASAQPQEGKL